MTDIVFLLLIFFLVTSTLINPNALKLLLPKSTGQVSAKATVSVSIKHWRDTDKFSYHINGDETPIRFDKIEDELIGSKTGRIMLQIHDGNNIKVLWRNFNLTKL